MTIATNDRIEKFGAQASVDDGSTSAIASGAFSVAADIAAWTNTDDAPMAALVLRCQWATVTGVANRAVNVYVRLLNIQGTNDPVSPGVNRFGTYLGSFTIYAASANTDYYFDARVELPNMQSGQEYEFYLENQSGQTISAGWALWVTPVTDGPK
ncbi:MAG: hypothetical protein IT530_16030 [Burkholderiales bacterium]|nr:hypothetical protein [Burkholderiales bacterium]